MIDITTLPKEELVQDLLDSLSDIETCQLALYNGVSYYSGGSVMERLKKNKYFVRVISAELKRREEEQQNDHN